MRFYSGYILYCELIALNTNSHLCTKITLLKTLLMLYLYYSQHFKKQNHKTSFGKCKHIAFKIRNITLSRVLRKGNRVFGDKKLIK